MTTPLIPQTIGVIYTCGLCPAATNRTVQVRIRREDEDIKSWIETAVTPALVRDHQAVSPTCSPTKLKEVKIPLPKGDNVRVGDPTGH